MRKFSTLYPKLLEKMEPPVFFGAALLVIGFCLFGGLFTDIASAVFGTLQSLVVDYFSWYYALVVTALLLFTFWLLLSPYRRIRLGKDDDVPQFSRPAWFAMLFSAGMGTGIVFWGVAEPLYHFSDPPSGNGESADAARLAMQYTFFHWGLHPWAIYAVFSIAMGYFHFRRDLPLAPRSLLHPLIGDRIYGWTGHCVDILCTVGTLLGVSTSLGLGAMQINSGLSQFTDLSVTTAIQVTIIAVITLVATISVVSGIKAGIKRLSQLNLGLSALLLLFVLLAGPTFFLLETFVGSIALYVQNLPRMSLWVDFTGDGDWQAQWTFFYWGWWLSWSPFVGIFLARISRGRTIREFIITALLVPSAGTFFWLSVFGGAALHGELFTDNSLISAVREDVAVSLHALLQSFPFSSLSMMLATLVIIVFFITSSDSGSLVDDMVTSGGHPNPPKAQRVFWAVSEGAVAGTLLVVGGLTAIQDASISMGFLMSFLLVLICISFTKALRQEKRQRNPGAADGVG